MSSIRTVPLARCTEPGCAWRWTTGPDRDCGQHETGADLDTRAADYHVILSTAPGDDDSEHAYGDPHDSTR